MRVQRILLIVLIVFPLAALAQTPEERIATAMARAQSAGIPTSLLESKIGEGRAKGIPMARIAAAVETRLENLEQAQAAMSRGAKDLNAAQLSVGADAIGAGVSQAVLETIASSAPRDRRAVAITALTQLVSQGIASEAALARVQEALARGPQALANLAAQSGVRRGRGPQETGSERGTSGAGNSGVGVPPPSIPAPGRATPPTPPRGGTSPRGGA